MSRHVDTKGLDRLAARFQKLAHVNAEPLMLSWMRISEEDNRKGILDGTDKDGLPMAPVTYRPKLSRGEKPHQLTIEERLGRRSNATRGAFAGGVNNNLSSSQYRKLDGPPLAPRRQFSRVITNLKLDYAELPSGRWEVTFWWDDVVSKKGVSFLRYHFEGAKIKARNGRVWNLPVRDLRGLRPTGVTAARVAARNFMIDQVRQYG